MAVPRRRLLLTEYDLYPIFIVLDLAFQRVYIFWHRLDVHVLTTVLVGYYSYRNFATSGEIYNTEVNFPWNR